MTRTPLSRSKGQRSRPPGRFTHRRVNASGSCSGDRGNVLTVGTYCYVAVCRRGRLGGARRFGTHRVRRGAGAYCDGLPHSLLNCKLDDTVLRKCTASELLFLATFEGRVSDFAASCLLEPMTVAQHCYNGKFLNKYFHFFSTFPLVCGRFQPLRPLRHCGARMMLLRNRHGTGHI